MKSNVSIKPVVQYKFCNYRTYKYALECEIVVNGEVTDRVTDNINNILNVSKWQEICGYDKIPYIPKKEFISIADGLYEALAKVKTQEVYFFSGWDYDGCNYILANCRIGRDGASAVMNQSSKYSLHINAKPDMDAIYTHIVNDYFKLLKHTSYPKVIMCVSLLSMYTSILQERYEYQPAFATYIQANYNKGKSATVNAMVNPWKNRSSSFEDSEASITQMMKDTKDTLLIIDDMSKSKRQGMIAKCERIIRLSGDTSTSAQKIVAGKIDSSMIRCMTILTGEELPRLQDSSYTRMLILKYDDDEVDWERLTLMQTNAELTAWFYVYFIQFYIHKGSFTDDLVAAFLKYREKYLEKFRDFEISNRYVDMLAWILAMWAKIIDFFKSAGKDVYNNGFVEDLEAIILRLGRIYSRKSPSKMFLTALFELISTNKLNIVTYAEAKAGDGCFDIMVNQNEYFIKSGAVYEKVEAYYRSINMDFNYTEAAVRKDLNSNALINRSGKWLTSEFKTREQKSVSGFYLLYENAKKFIKNDMEEQINE